MAGKPGLNRYLRTIQAGNLRIDHEKIKIEENPHLRQEGILGRSDVSVEAQATWTSGRISVAHTGSRRPKSVPAMAAVFALSSATV